MMQLEWTGRLSAPGYLGLLVWAAYASWELDFPFYAALALFAGIAVLVLYLQALRFFALEAALRPVLDDLARAATGDARLAAPGLPLRTRLLAALPAINVITGFTAVGVSGLSHDLGPADMALALLVSVVMAATVSLALTVLLANSVTAPIDELDKATRRLADGDLTARVPVVTTDETGALARSFNEMAAGLEQRERLREAFGTFVDPQLAERVAEEGTDFAGEEVELSLLFMDVRGFTAYAESAPARDVVSRLNDLYGEVVPIVLDHGGHANKFIGDGLLAVFGAPDRLDDHAARAVAAAIEIARRVRERYDGEVSVGIGVNSGQVVVGTIGGGGRLDFTVIGDAVNTAARVEAATRETGDDLLITEATRASLAGEDGDWLERSGIELKGKSEAVRLYTPKALDAAGSGAD
jgi:class 3 adenylate cyclase